MVRPARAVHQDVGGLTSRCTSPAACAESSADATAETNASGPVRRSGPSRRISDAQVAARHVAHRDVQHAVGLARAVDRDDVRIVDRGRGPRLPDEPLPELVVSASAGVDDLQRDRPPQPLVAWRGTPPPYRPPRSAPPSGNPPAVSLGRSTGRQIGATPWRLLVHPRLHTFLCPRQPMLPPGAGSERKNADIKYIGDTGFPACRRRPGPGAPSLPPLEPRPHVVPGLPAVVSRRPRPGRRARPAAGPGTPAAASPQRAACPWARGGH